MARLRRWIVAGLLVWVPLGVTFLVIRFLINLTDQTLLLVPWQLRPENMFGFSIPGLGVILTLLVVIGTGMVVANFLGSKLVRFWEDLLARIPLVRSIYSSVKQITETVFSSQGKSFRKVILVEYPRRDLWTLAFITGDTAATFIDITGRNLVSIYVPTTPNPTSGFFLMVPREDIVELDIPVDVGLKLILSTGVVIPAEVHASASADKPQRAAPAAS